MTTTNTTTDNIVRDAVAQAPTDYEGREVKKVRACEARAGDIELVSKNKPEQNRTIEEIRTDGEVTTMWFVGSPNWRTILKDQRITIAR